MTPERPRASLVDLETNFLPVGQMRQISRITELAGPTIVGEVDLGPDHWAFAQHLPGDPVFPGSLIVEAAGQLVALWAWAGGERGRPRLLRANAEFRLPVGPAEPRLMLRGEVTRKRHMHFATITVEAGGLEVASVSVVLAVIPEADREAGAADVTL
jgi:3-hydroxymyristoyl/3-hydroxydecanoyl-(acyl carrier protein) dehydratase